MSTSLTYCYLPNEIHKWPGLPLSLSGDEVMPLDYGRVTAAGCCTDAGWIKRGSAISSTVWGRQLWWSRHGGSMIIRW